MPVDWSHLEHAYGSAEDVPSLLDRVGDPESDVVMAWEDLWSSLYHQGTVYSASFAALPALAAIATGRRPGNSFQALIMAGSIVGNESQLHEPGYVREHYPEVLAELTPTARHHLMDPFDGDTDDYLNSLEILLAFEEVPAWRESLCPNLYDVVCPSCSANLEIDLYEMPPGVRYVDSPNSIRLVNFKDPTEAHVRPTPRTELWPLAARLHRMAIDSGQAEAADYLTYVFGSASCPACGQDFSVPDRIEASCAARDRAWMRRRQDAGVEPPAG